MNRIYRNIDEVLADRRKGETLRDVVENLLHSPRVMEQIETPFDVIEGFFPNDYVNACSMGWCHLSVEYQIKYASAYQRWYAKRSGHASIEGTFDLVPGTETKMMLIPPMRYEMGFDIFGGDEVKPVSVKKPSWVGKYEVTQWEWDTVMGPYALEFQREGRARWPVNRVSWFACQEFCEKTGMRLPDEKVWEMACRAGTTTTYSFGEDLEKLGQYAWYAGNTEYHLQPVGRKLSNAWGLHDMHGNIWEWCQNKANMSPSDRIIRGGGHSNPAGSCASAYRTSYDPSSSFDSIGFRVWRPV